MPPKTKAAEREESVNVMQHSISRMAFQYQINFSAFIT